MPIGVESTKPDMFRVKTASVTADNIAGGFGSLFATHTFAAKDSGLLLSVMRHGIRAILI